MLQMLCALESHDIQQGLLATLVLRLGRDDIFR
jgi:hypothetical protein